MKKGWTNKRIGEIATLKPPKSEARERVPADALVSFLPMEDLGIAIKYPKPKQTKRLSDVVGSYTYFAEGDVLLAKITPCFENGKIGIATGLKNGVGFGSSEFIVIRPDSTVNKEWLFYFLSRDDFRNDGSQRMGGAVGQQRVPKEFVESYEIPVPPLPEQQRIVGVLDEAFASLATAQAHAAQNLQNASDLFESHLNAIFTQRGKGWVEHRLGDVFDIGSSKRIRESEWTSSGVPFYGGKEIVRLSKVGFVVSDAYISEAKYGEYALRHEMPQPGDLLITARGTIGVGYVVRYGDKFYYKDGNIISLREKTPTNPHFVLYAFRSKPVVAQFADLTGATVTHLPIERAKNLLVSMPNFPTQCTVAEHLSIIETEAQRLESIYQRKLVVLEELKKSLLHQAFSGEL
jgi:type I restriction enzyme S subunit